MGAGASLGVRLVGVDVDHSCSEEDFGGHVERLTVDTFRTIDESCKDSSDRAADESCCTMDSFSVDDSAVSVLCLAESFQFDTASSRVARVFFVVVFVVFFFFFFSLSLSRRVCL